LELYKSMAEEKLIDEQVKQKTVRVIHPVQESFSFINIRRLFQSPKPPPLDAPAKKSGYLFKQGGLVKSWKKRWFVVRGDSMYYYDDSKSLQQKGSFCITNCIAQEAKNKTQRENSFAIYDVDNKSRTYFLQALSPNDYDDWVNFLNIYISEDLTVENGIIPTNDDVDSVDI